MKLRFLVKSTLTAFLLFCFAGQAGALTLSDVGAVDSLVARTTLSNSSDLGETLWVQSILGNDYEMTFKTENTDSDWNWTRLTDTASTFAYDMGDQQPAYYLIKTGNIRYSVFNTFLFENFESLAWAVIDLQDLGLTGRDILNIGKISHIDGFDNGNQPVPEPATLFLLGSGLIGLSSLRKKKKNA
jgi:hypothetical protein